MKVLSLLLSLLAVAGPLHRETIDLSASGWNITLDKTASWEYEELFLPPVDLSKVPVNIPTGGWDLLDQPQVRNINLPATVEEYLWGWNGGIF